MRRQFLLVFRLALVPGGIALALGACAYRKEKDGSDGSAADNTARNASGPSPSYAQVLDQVLSKKCTTCHAEFKQYPTTYAKRADIQQQVFVDRVMPKGDVLSTSQSLLLQAWLTAGAPEQSQPGPTSTTPAPPASPGPVASSAPITPLEPTWENVQKHCFGEYCTRCHSGDSPDGDLDLTDVVQIRTESKKIMDRMFFNTEKPMPPRKEARDKITAEDKVLLIDWIAAKMPDENGVIAAPSPKPTPSATPPPSPRPTPSTVPSPLPSASPSVVPSAL